MPEQDVAEHRTRAFARGLGPFIAIVPSIIAVRVHDMPDITAAMTGNIYLVWFSGAFLLLWGSLIIAFHQYWRSAAAIMISLFGWFLALRGVTLMAIPQTYLRGASMALNAPIAMRVGFCGLALIGAYLLYVGWRPAGR